MACLECGNNSLDVLSFRVIEVHTLHIRDFDGEKIIQALGEFQEYEICTACALEGVQAILFPARRLLVKCFPFAVLGIVGVILTLAVSFRDVIAAIRALGPLAVIVGVIEAAEKIRDILWEREAVGRMKHDEAVRYSAWQLLLKNAPKKYKDNDITYIPINEETIRMNTRELSERYGIIPAIADKLRSQIV